MMSSRPCLKVEVDEERIKRMRKMSEHEDKLELGVDEDDEGGQVDPGIRDYYTDILCHAFNPPEADSTRLAVGTNFGNVYVIGEKDDKSLAEFSPTNVWESELEFPVFEPVVSLSWDTSASSLFLLSNRKLYHLKNYEETGAAPQAIFGPLLDKSDFMDFAILKNSPAFCIVSDKSKTVIVDQEKRRIALQLSDHKGVVQVVKATEDYVATGGIDGFVNLYDGRFRTKKKIASFDTKNCVNNLAINGNSVWLAVSGTKSSEFPSLYNIRSGKQIPSTVSPEKANEREKISAIHFDAKDSLYWGGSDGYIYKSDDLLLSKTELKAAYGRAEIPQVLSITTTRRSGKEPIVSVAGATNSILFSSCGLFWDTMVQVSPKGKKHAHEDLD